MNTTEAQDAQDGPRTVEDPAPPRDSLSWRATERVMSVLNRVLRADIVCEGLEHLSDKPCLYVVNHFTRFETFIIPYVLYKHTGRAVRSLAYHQLFKGKLGEYLQSLGGVSTRHPRKNRLIIGDLMAGRSSWVIFPEGAMVKSKRVMERGRYWIRHPKRSGPPHTGAAVLALKAQFSRNAFARARELGRADLVQNYCERYGLEADQDLSAEDIQIVPVTITYYPLRPGKNLLSKVAGFIFKDLPPNVMEELVVEGQLLLSDSDITVYFGEPISVEQYVRPLGRLALMAPLGRKLAGRADMIARLQRKRLMRRFMCEIYSQTTINIDHLFCGALRARRDPEISVENFYRAIYLSALEVRQLGNRRLHESLRNKLVTMLTEDVHPLIEDIFRLVEDEGVVSRAGGVMTIDQEALEEEHSFDDVRVKNTTMVIANEVLPLRQVCRILKETVNLSTRELREQTADALCARDQADFGENYHRYYEEGASKPPEIGRPFLLEGTRPTGIVLSHGYLAAPHEVRPLAEYLNGLGFTVYGVRLEGHGTSPAHLRDVTWENWLYSYYRGYAVMRNLCSEIIVGGFSTGGLVSLLTAARMGEAVKGVFAINASLRLRDIRTRFVAPFMFWTDVLQKFGRDSEEDEYVEHRSENPNINYSRNYIHGIRELQRLIGVCEDALPSIRIPSLILQGRNDPAVNPRSATLIFEALASPQKELKWMDFDRHVIVQGERRDEVFREIETFVESVATPLSA